MRFVKDEFSTPPISKSDFNNFVKSNLPDWKCSVSTLGDIKVQLALIPTSNKLFGYTATVAALAIAVVSVFVGVLAYVGALPHH